MTEINEKLTRPFAFLKFLPTNIAPIAKATQTIALTKALSKSATDQMELTNIFENNTMGE